jgi:hypothetical protein
MNHGANNVLVVAALALGLSCSDLVKPPEGLALYINEFMVRNSSASLYADCLGNHEDWVEVYNGGAADLHMDDFYLSDRRDDLRKYRLHDTVIPPGGFYLLWGGDQDCGDSTHIGFGFDGADSTKNEMIVLSMDNGIIVDSISFLKMPGACEQDKSFGRSPDGSPLWQQQAVPSPGSANLR